MNLRDVLVQALSFLAETGSVFSKDALDADVVAVFEANGVDVDDVVREVDVDGVVREVEEDDGLELFLD